MDGLGKEQDDIALWLGRKIMQIGGIDVPISFTSPGRMPVSFHAFATDRVKPELHARMIANEVTE